jgi:hypothetical protein
MIISTRYRATTVKVLAIAVLMAVLAASLLVAAKPSYASTTFTVINTKDSGAGTLRQAMFDANVTPGADVINFNIAGTDVKTITPTTALPKITEAVTINGYSQPGAHPNTKAIGSDAVLKIELSGASAPPDANGLWITTANSTVRGLVINRWGAPGSLESAIRIQGSGATGNRVAGNFIGTDATGTQDLGNAGVGVYVEDAPGNTIGGTAVAARNVISGNAYGIGIGGAAKGTTVAGNYVGTDASGTEALGNTFYGVYIDSGSNNIIGGTSAAERNVISGNDGSGVLIANADTNANKVLGNYIGTDKNGADVLGNSAHGISIYDAKNTVIGSATAGGRNVISGNEGSGVNIYGDTATGNRILSNSIYANGGLGIDLGDDGPTPNDPGDTDTGANGLQNKPVLSSARKSSTGTTTVRGTLNSTPGKTFQVQFFSNPSGTEEGKTFLGSKSVTTNGSGNVSFAYSTKKAIRLGQNITATATGAGGTSEFSGPRKVVAR